MEIKQIFPENYPYLLKQTSRQPKHLDICGKIPTDEYKFLCVVGSRTYSEYGEKAVRHLIAGLKGQKIVIVSGLAVGIDSIAHEAALDAGLTTLAFPGSGLRSDVLYPSTRRKLAERIVASGGALISPFKYDQTGDFWTFPTRNRLMAAFSHAVLVIEGRQGSGTLGTADFALEFNRDVLAVPGEIFAELGYGPHILIRDGATPIRYPHEILTALGLTVDERQILKPSNQFRLHHLPAKRHKIGKIYSTKPSLDSVPLPTVSRQAKAVPSHLSVNTFNLSPSEQLIADELRVQKLSASDLIHKTSLSSIAFSIAISELEMKNLVTEDLGIYRLTMH